MKFCRNEFKYAENDLDTAYMIGMYLSDGYIVKGESGNRYSGLGITNKDIEVINGFISFTESKFGKRPAVQTNKLPYYIATITSRTLGEWLVENTDSKKKLPEFIFQESREWKLRFLSALLDCDGWATFSANRYETKNGKPPTWYSQLGICGVRENTYLNEVPRILDQLGCLYKINYQAPRKQGYLEQQRILINPKSALECGLYFTIGRKQEKLNSIRKYILPTAFND